MTHFTVARGHSTNERNNFCLPQFLLVLLFLAHLVLSTEAEAAGADERDARTSDKLEKADDKRDNWQDNDRRAKNEDKTISVDEKLLSQVDAAERARLSGEMQSVEEERAAIVKTISDLENEIKLCDFYVLYDDPANQNFWNSRKAMLLGKLLTVKDLKLQIDREFASASDRVRKVEVELSRWKR